PEDSPSMVAVEAMDEAFGNGGSESFIVVAMERTSGLTQRDRVYAEGLVDQLGEYEDDVVFVQDLRERGMRAALTSEDNQARYLLVGITGATGAPSSLRQVETVREVVREHAPEGLSVRVTGPTATVVDLTL